MPKISPFLWYDTQAEEAANLYTSVFPDAKIEMTSDFIGVFEIQGQRFYALNGGPMYKFTEAFSLSVDCKTQEEVDRYWTKLTADGGQEGPCGWCKDKFGLSWQVTPSLLGQMLSDTDRKKAARVMEAMMKMKKLDIAALKRAYEG